MISHISVPADPLRIYFVKYLLHLKHEKQKTIRAVSAHTWQASQVLDSVRLHGAPCSSSPMGPSLSSFQGVALN